MRILTMLSKLVCISLVSTFICGSSWFFIDADVFTNTKSIQYAGATQALDVGSAMKVESNVAWTMSAWIKPSSLTGTPPIIADFDAASPNRGIFWGVMSTGVVYTQIINNFPSHFIDVRTGAGAVSTGSWQHVVFTYAGTALASGVKFYVNGSSVSVSTTTDTLTGTILSSSNMLIARDYIGDSFSGDVDEVSFWNVALNSTQVTELYNSGHPSNLQNFSARANGVNWWRMGDGATYPTIPDLFSSQSGTMLNQTSGNIVTDVP